MKAVVAAFNQEKAFSVIVQLHRHRFAAPSRTSMNPSLSSFQAQSRHARYVYKFSLKEILNMKRLDKSYQNIQLACDKSGAFKCVYSCNWKPYQTGRKMDCNHDGNLGYDKSKAIKEEEHVNQQCSPLHYIKNVKSH